MAFDQVANPVPSYTRKQAHRVAHTEGPTGKYLQWERILYSHTHTTLMRRLPSRLESSRLCIILFAMDGSQFSRFLECDSCED